MEPTSGQGHGTALETAGQDGPAGGLARSPQRQLPLEAAALGAWKGQRPVPARSEGVVVVMTDADPGASRAPLRCPGRRPANSSRSGTLTSLRGRRSECDALDRLIDAVCAGESRVLVVRGDAGMGKTVLLDYLAERAQGCRVARAVGVQSEMELASAGLHQLCAPMLEHLDRLPVPQRDALRTAFGMGTGVPPERFLVGLAVLSLLSEVADEQPLICLIDDQHWLDHASAQALGFAARRLAADPVGLVFATREPGEELAGLPELAVEGLRDDHARALLGSALAGPLDARVRDLIVAETRGNPLALLELPRGLTPTELAGGFGLPGAQLGAGPSPGRIEESFRQQLEELPVLTRRMLQLAAADPSGDPVLVRRAAGRLVIPVQAAAPAVEARLVEFGIHVRFRHPLLRSAVYRSASAADRQELHRALAEVTDPAADPDRRAWHQAQAAPGLDEEVAAELERSAGRAQARGGLAAAAAFLERAVLLTADPARHAERTLAAAQANLQAGAFGKALELLVTAEAGPLDEFASARVDLLRGQIAGDALVRLAEITQAGGTDFGLGMEARSRALVSEPEAAESLYREAVDRLGRTQLRPELARAHLLFGEWLRRQNRRVDARAQLRIAHQMLDGMGMAAFAERARRELLATGETARKRSAEMFSTLTAQELSIAGLVVDGRTNREIGAELFLSDRTVEWHLHKIFTKLDIGSRRELRGALPVLRPYPRA